MNSLPVSFRNKCVLVLSVLSIFFSETAFGQFTNFAQINTPSSNFANLYYTAFGGLNPQGYTFVTSGYDRMYLDKDGNLGIGVIPAAVVAGGVPVSKLSVLNDFRVSSGASAAPAVSIQALGTFNSLNYNISWNGNTDIKNNTAKNGWKLYTDQSGSNDVMAIAMYPVGSGTRFPFSINSTGNVSMDGNVTMANDVLVGNNLYFTRAGEQYISKDDQLTINSKLSNIRFITTAAGLNRLLIQNNGNVGIGVNYAAVGFHVAKNTMIEDNTAPSKSSIVPTVSGNGAIAIGATTYYAWLQSRGGQPLFLNPGSDANAGTTSSLEYVGIGFKPENMGSAVVPKGYMLAVNGNIICNAVKVKAFGNWSDFVFDDAYALQSLDEVENYIHANKHLPNIPSAAEVNQEGFELADMDAKFLRKIEELTLYMIEQNKETQAIKAELKLLRAENEALKIQIIK